MLSHQLKQQPQQNGPAIKQNKALPKQNGVAIKLKGAISYLNCTITLLIVVLSQQNGAISNR
jgi:hypothetical protein